MLARRIPAFRTHKMTAACACAETVRADVHKSGQLTAEITNYILHTYSRTAFAHKRAHCRNKLICYIWHVISVPEHYWDASSDTREWVDVCGCMVMSISFSHYRWECSPMIRNRTHTHSNTSMGVLFPLAWRHCILSRPHRPYISATQTNHTRSEKYYPECPPDPPSLAATSEIHPRPFWCYDFIIIVIITTPWHAI